VEVAPNADPPVCRILDFGKFKYRQKKKHSQKRHVSHVKEVRIGLNTDEHDLNFKAERIRRFLAEGNKVAVTMRLSGREKAHGDLALEHMSEFGKRFEDIAKFEKAATRERAALVSMLLVARSRPAKGGSASADVAGSPAAPSSVPPGTNSG